MPAEADQPVLVAVSVDPAVSHRATEAIRIALGIRAGANAVTVALLGSGVKVLDAEVAEYVDGDDLARHLTTLKKLGQAFHVEGASIPSTRDWNPAGVTVVPIDRVDLARLVAASRRTVVF